MAQIAVPDANRIVCHQTRGNEEVVNVWHVRSPDPFSPAELIAIQNAFTRFYANPSTDPVGNRGIDNFRDAGVVFDRLTVQRIDTTPYPDPTELILNEPGADAGQLVPLQTALCVSLRTGVATRSARGRVYLGGFNESANDETADGFPRPSTAFLLAVSNAFNDLMDAIRAANLAFGLGVASYTQQVIREVTDARIKNVWSTQRRRTESVPITATTVVSNS